MVVSRKKDISDDGEVTCGVMVIKGEFKGHGRLVDSGLVFGVVT